MAEDEYYQQFLGRDSLMPLYSRQVVASARLLLADDAQLKVEAYHKAYRDFPQDRIRQTSFLVDQIGLEYFENLPLVVASTGRAESNGLELTLQKRLVKGFYGLLTAAWSSSRYEDQWGKWRPRAFDNRGLVAVSGGYKPSPAWEFSARWIYAGGQPYSPVDPSRSELWGQTILDFEQVNMARFPDYHSLNIRVDRRFSFSGSNLAVYLSIWNLYDRRNVFEFYWNIVEEREDAFYQWGIIPLIGLEYEF